MTNSWSGGQLHRISRSSELQVAPRPDDGTLRGWVPIWVVCVDDRVYVRTWYRRVTGWFGRAIDHPYARIRVPGLDVDKYGPSGSRSMVTDGAVATALRIDLP